MAEEDGVPAVRSAAGSLAVDATIACPFCAEQIQPAAKKCRHCGEILDAVMRKQQEGARVGGPGAAAASASSTVVIRDGHRGMNHALHVLLCFVTLGLWIPVYIVIAILHGMNRNN